MRDSADAAHAAACATEAGALEFPIGIPIFSQLGQREQFGGLRFDLLSGNDPRLAVEFRAVFCQELLADNNGAACEFGNRLIDRRRQRYRPHLLAFDAVTELLDHVRWNSL